MHRPAYMGLWDAVFSHAGLPCQVSKQHLHQAICQQGGGQGRREGCGVRQRAIQHEALERVLVKGPGREGEAGSTVQVNGRFGPIASAQLPAA